MSRRKRAEAARWGWLALTVTVLGVALFAAPWIPGKYKYILGIPLYVAFVYVYYKYFSLRKSSSAPVPVAAEAGDSPAVEKPASRKKRSGKRKSKPKVKE